MKLLVFTALILTLASPTLACETVTSGEMAIENAWSRATIGANRPAVFYVAITNAGSSDDALIGIATPAASMPMLHQTVVNEGIASMPHAMSIPIAAGQSVQLAPGGYHGMLMGLTEALKVGDNFPMTLTFQNAGDVTINVEVLSIRAEGPDCETDGQ